MQRRIRVRGIMREEIDSEQLAFVFFQLGKRAVENKRKRAQAERDRKVRREKRS
jgi:hypothetical protein